MSPQQLFISVLINNPHPEKVFPCMLALKSEYAPTGQRKNPPYHKEAGTDLLFHSELSLSTAKCNLAFRASPANAYRNKEC